MTTTMWPLRRAVAVARDRVAVTCGGDRFTYREVAARSACLAAGLRDLGLAPGDRVAVVGANCHRYLELYQTVPGAGFVLVPLNQRHTDVELGDALADSGARVLFTNRGIDGLPGVVERVIDLDEGYERLLADGAGATTVELPGLSGDDLAGLFYTGGTTGGSKGVMLTHHNLVANALNLQAHGGVDADTVWLIAAPLFHAAGSLAVLATVWHGARQVVLPAFDPGRALDLITSERVTATLVVPTMLAALAEEQLVRPRDVSSLRTVTHGGSPVASETLRRARLAFPGVELVHTYGATETAPLATLLRHEDVLLDGPRGRSCGQPLIGVEVRITDVDGHEVPHGSVGELRIRGANVMQGYWNKPDETAAALVDGWYRSGDLGSMDDEGYVFLVDRVKDMIITGGENVYSTEVEDVLYRHPAVLEAAVFGIPDDRWGEAVHAVVVLRPGAVADADELIAACRAAIAGYKVPKRIDLRADALPKSGAGKILKRELRAPFWAGAEPLLGGRSSG
jgi:long-chain acyl-CoA synthetase